MCAGCGPASLRVLSQHALRQHLLNCCIAIEDDIILDQKALVEDHAGQLVCQAYMTAYIMHAASHTYSAAGLNVSQWTHNTTLALSSGPLLRPGASASYPIYLPLGKLGHVQMTAFVTISA